MRVASIGLDMDLVSPACSLAVASGDEVISRGARTVSTKAPA